MDHFNCFVVPIWDGHTAPTGNAHAGFLTALDALEWLDRQTPGNYAVVTKDGVAVTDWRV